jgi:hypothetical protein
MNIWLKNYAKGWVYRRRTLVKPSVWARIYAWVFLVWAGWCYRYDEVRSLWAIGVGLFVTLTLVSVVCDWRECHQARVETRRSKVPA